LTYRRTVVVGLASAGLVLWSLAPAAGDPAAPSPAAPFANGVAKATAIVSRVAPGVGSLELGVSSGIAVSEVTNQLAQAQAQTLDLGLIGTTLTAEGCDGSDPPASDDELPQPTRVDNRDGDAEATSDEIPLAGANLGAGRESARATRTPLSAAVATSAASFGPVLSIGGGRAQAVTEIIDGAARQARATVDANLEIAGVIDLSGLRWEAVHRTGADPGARGAFDIGTAEVLGVPVPVESLTDLQTTLNEALAPSGITVTLPRVERFTEPADVVRVTPLRLVLKDSPVGKAALGPGLELTREERSQIFEDVAAAYCQAAGALLVGDIAVSVASGTGFLAVEVGGAEATSGELVLGNPFGDIGGVTATPGPLPSLVPGATVIPGAPGSAAAGAPVPGAAGAAPQAVADVGPLRELCETIHPFQWPSCSEGAMAPLGLLGLLATIGVGALDWRHQRPRLATASGSAA